MPKSKRKAGCLLPEALLLVLALGGQQTVYSQHQGHGGPQFGVSATAAGIIAETLPLHDSILAGAPDRVELAFDQPVELVKLVIYDNQRKWVDIGFRYRPGSGTAYSWPVPSLQQAPYYSVSWAVLDDRDRLVRGSFSFSFGPGAETPSMVMEREMEHAGHSLMDMEEIERLRQAEPAGIRFGDEPEPNFEPPFAPVLGQPR